MKLNKDTKYDLEIGDILSYSNDNIREVITNLSTASNGRNIYITVRCIKDENPVGRNWSMYGQVSYSVPVGQYYGCEIIKPTEFTDEDIDAIEDLHMQDYYDWQ